MNILLLTPMAPRANAPGAMPLVFHALLSELAQRHRVTLLTVTGTDPGEHEAVEQVRQAGVRIIAPVLFTTERRQRLERWLTLGAKWGTSAIPMRSLWFYSAQLQHALDQIAGTETFDLIHVEDNAMGMYALPRHIPTVFTEHEVRKPRPVQWSAARAPGMHKWAWAEIEWQRMVSYQKAVWQRFNRIQVFTENDAEAIRAMLPEVASRLFVNPFGVAIPQMPLDPNRQHKHSLLFVGNFYHTPNTDAALFLGHEIMPALWRLVPDALLKIVGTNPPESVRRLAGNAIEVTGFVPEIEPYLAQASVIVAPVRIGGGMRMKVLQNMAYGKAVVTTVRGASGLQMEGQSPPLKVAQDADSFARAIAELMTNDEMRTRIGLEAREFVARHFSPQAYVRRVEQCYASVLASHTQEQTKA